MFEVRFGLARLAGGRRRQGLEEAFAALLREDLGGRVAPLDRATAEAAGLLAARREAAGRMVDVRDTLIGGVAIARRALVATRTLRHYSDLESGAVDPWGRRSPAGDSHTGGLVMASKPRPAACHRHNAKGQREDALGRTTGIEPATTGTTNRRSTN